MDCGIYEILNIVTGKRYIGSSNNITSRKSNHFSTLNSNTHGNIHLQRSYNKYGKDNFLFNVLEYCSEDNLRDREQHYIECYDFSTELYNIKSDAVHQSGWNHSDEAKKKMSESHTGKTFSDEHRKALSKVQLKRSPESYEKSREFMTGRFTGEDNPNYGNPSPLRKRVAKMDIDTGEVLEIYDSITEASELTGISRRGIGAVVSGYTKMFKNGKTYEVKTAGGFRWKEM